MKGMTERAPFAPLTPEMSDQLEARKQFEILMNADTEAGQMIADIHETAARLGVDLRGYDAKEEQDPKYAELKAYLLEKEAEVTQELFHIDSALETLKGFGLKRPYDA